MDLLTYRSDLRDAVHPERASAVRDREGRAGHVRVHLPDGMLRGRLVVEAA
jgi:hypothetical protein